MNEYTLAEKITITKYLVEAASRLLKDSRLTKIDFIAELFVAELERLGETEKAEKVYKFYQEL